VRTRIVSGLIYYHREYTAKNWRRAKLKLDFETDPCGARSVYSLPSATLVFCFQVVA